MQREVRSRRIIATRRLIFFLFVTMTVTLLTALLVSILHGYDHLFAFAAILTAFVVNTTWMSLAFWNAAIGLVLLCRRDGLAAASPLMSTLDDASPIVVRTAVVMPVRDESTDEVFARLRAIKSGLDKSSAGACFDYFILSDSARPDIVAAEAQMVEQWHNELPDPARVTYRHRPENYGFKPGNVHDFCRRWGASYSFMLLLDADSLMSADTVLRLVRLMQGNSKIGILQTLIVGILTPSFFARVFEFGHRHALRCSAVGAAWWQADRCQFWGHNALVRLEPFTRYCEMPYLPGKGPFSGHIICHDQIEASFMHRAGYDVRVLPCETESYEGVPPTVIDFITRNNRWCQGNIKNLKIMGAVGIASIDRFQLGVVAQRFIAWPALVVFAILTAVAAISWPDHTPFAALTALGLYALWMLMLLSPKLMGVAISIMSSPARYGGTARLLFGALVEILFTLLLAPVTMVATTVFMIGLVFGRALVWNSQARIGYRIQWRDAVARLRIETALGCALLIICSASGGSTVLWLSPVWIGLLLAVPFAMFTSSRRLDRWAKSWRICASPEEVDPSPVIRDFLRAVSRVDSAPTPLADATQTATKASVS